MACPLCRGKNIGPFFSDRNRQYLRCCDCLLVYVPTRYWLSSEAEKTVYDQHENSAGDQGYRQFLSRLSVPLLEKLKPNQNGLDFGCGPGPTLSALMAEHDHQMELYDPFYFNNPEVLSSQYDFICATEVVEHFKHPDREFNRLFSLIKPGGWLGLMTKLVIDRQAFSQWHYIRDLTHICFYCHNTFRYLAQRYDAKLSLVAKDVILLQKNT